MSISEKIELLGKGLYKDIPDELTLKSIPTGSELDYVGAEDFDEVMLTKILPQCIEEPINPKNLLEIDYQWVLRCLRFVNYGPYINIGAIFCDGCGSTTRGEFVANLETVPCKALPEGFKNEITISREEFLEFKDDIVIALPTIQEMQNAERDKQFQDALGKSNRKFARICYMIKSIGGQKLDPVSIRLRLQKELSSADYLILQDRVQELTDYGLRGGGSIKCPKCGNDDAAFIAFLDERFFRPDVACLRKWKNDRTQRETKDVSSNEANEVRRDNGRDNVHSESNGGRS